MVQGLTVHWRIAKKRKIHCYSDETTARADVNFLVGVAQRKEALFEYKTIQLCETPEQRYSYHKVSSITREMSVGLRNFHSSLVPRARLALSKYTALNGGVHRVSNPRYISMTTTMLNDQEMKTVMNTYQKFFKIPDGAKVSRHNYVSFSKDFERATDKVEAFFINSVLMKFADLYGLEKFPEEGGKVYTLEELYKALKRIPNETLDFYIKAVHRALFRATDTNNNGYISRDEWAVLLKILNLYESDEHALRSFDSLDANKDGQISMEEFEKFGVKFWGDSLSEVSDFYGTSASASSR